MSEINRRTSLLMLVLWQWAAATAFTGQGKLNDSGNPANGLYDFQFKLARYHMLPLLRLEAIKELKAENDAFKQQLKQQQAPIDSLKKLVCLDHPNTDLCR